MSSKLECVTFSTLDSYTGEDVRNACCYTFVVLSALEAFLHLAQVGYRLEFPVMVSLTFHLNQFHFQFRKFFSLFVIFFFFLRVPKERVLLTFWVHKSFLSILQFTIFTGFSRTKLDRYFWHKI